MLSLINFPLLLSLPTVLPSNTSYMERLLKDGGDLDSVDRSLLDFSTTENASSSSTLVPRSSSSNLNSSNNGKMCPVAVADSSSLCKEHEAEMIGETVQLLNKEPGKTAKKDMIVRFKPKEGAAKVSTNEKWPKSGYPVFY